MTDTIHIEGIRVFGHHGVLQHERELGQEFSIDVTLEVDMSAAGVTDELSYTVDYGMVAQLVHDRVAGEPVALLERLAADLCNSMVSLPRVREVSVAIHKPHAPMPVGVADVVVRRRQRCMVQAVLGLGANLDQPIDTIRQALIAVGTSPQVELVAVSSLYRTAPVGGPDQDDYVNAVAVVRTTLDALGLLRVVQGVEAQAGRIRQQRWGPRVLDIDVLDFAGQWSAESWLQLPHPQAHKRAFVLAPWAEIAPETVIAGKPVSYWLAQPNVVAQPIHIIGQLDLPL